MSLDLKKDILEAKEQYEASKKQVKTGYCQCMRTKDKDEYWGYWIECECGYKSNTDGATYCGGCGKKINIVGTTAEFKHFGER